MTDRVAFELVPDDVLFFRDGKPSSLGSDHYLRSLFPPFPSTLYGALRTRRLVEEGIDPRGLERNSWCARLNALTKELGEWGGFGSLELRGPWMTLDGETLLPAPLDLGITLREKETGEVGHLPAVRSVARYRLLPKSEHGGWSHPLRLMAPFQLRDGEWKAWPPAEGEPRPAEGWYLRPDGVEAWRRGGVPKPEHFVHPRQLWLVEARTGVGLQDDIRASRHGRLYTFGFLRLLQGVALGFDVGGSSLKPEGRVRLGGEGRTATLRPGPDFPRAAREIEGERLCISVVTPALSDIGGYPPGFVEDALEAELAGRRLRLVGAILPGFVTAGGWDLALNQAKPLRRAIPSGSVFLFEPADGGRIKPAEFDGICLSDINEEGLARQGFGFSAAGLSL